MVVRVEETGASEGHPVTGWIGGRCEAEVPRPERAQTSGWSFVTREFGERAQEERQMKAIPRMVCASSGEPLTWDSIDWTQCKRNVSKLQTRIVKATREGRRGKVKALQWLLTHSL
jgi:RNA-directed DNA polymerase